MSWLSGYRRLSPRYERRPRNYLAFLGLAAAVCCYKRLVRLTTQDTILGIRKSTARGHHKRRRSNVGLRLIGDNERQNDRLEGAGGRADHDRG